MTDTSLPNQPTPTNNSYVDSYAPPQPVAAATPAPTPVAQTPISTTSSATPAPTADPLAELEKALKEYEERQKQLAGKQQETVQKTQAVVEEESKEDPLAELEKVLDEYEAKYKQAQPADAANEPVAAATNASDQPLTQAEYQSVLKNEPIKPAAATDVPAANLGASEPIEEQNIFELLGVIDAEPTEKEAFLDELQQALWEDFLDKDLSLLVSADNLKIVQDLRTETNLDEKTRQEQLIAMVEQLVPDVEEIMLEKALELKEEMVKERLVGMKEYYAARPAEFAKINEAEQQILAGRWKTGAQLLNTLTA
jgi:hypothetical protein